MEKLGNILSKVCAAISGLCLSGLIIINFADSIGRQIGQPVKGAQEIASFLLCIFFFSSLPILVRANGHIRVGLLTDFYRGLLKRAEHIWALVFEAAATLFLFYIVFDFAGRLDRIGQVSRHFEVEFAPIVYGAAALTLIAVIFVFERQFRNLPDERPQAEQDAHHIPGDQT